jgi:hypothetical protein
VLYFKVGLSSTFNIYSPYSSDGISEFPLQLFAYVKVLKSEYVLLSRAISQVCDLRYIESRCERQLSCSIDTFLLLSRLGFKPLMVLISV